MKNTIAKTKKPVPQIWYNEIINENARRIMECATRVRTQQNRVDECIKSGVGYEVMQGGNGHSWQIPLSQLEGYVLAAKEDELNLPKYKQYRIDFKAKYCPVKELKGNLIAAKLEAKIKVLKGVKYDYNYTLLSKLEEKYLLSSTQGNKLMEYFYKIGISF